MAPSIEERVAAMQERLRGIEGDVESMQADVREIRDALVTVKGGWRLLTLIVGVSAALGALLTKFIPWVSALPR